ncbi:MAG: hypothetical protein H6591_13425 [Flavobacteriales bacterium]|nr:hypothetical protein [Flavobacteriales bacterium]
MLRTSLMLLALVSLPAWAQIGFGITIPAGRSTARLGTVPDSLATYAIKEVDLRPRPPGGLEGWMAALATDDTCAAQADSLGCQRRSKVVARFTVERDGTLSDPQILKGTCASAEERLRCAINSSPPWEPGRIGYHKVRTRMQVSFRAP